MKRHLAILVTVLLLGTGSVFSDMEFGFDYDEGVAGATSTQDLSANNRDGALSGTAAIVTDATRGSVLQITDSTGRAVVTGYPGITSSNFTFMTWFKSAMTFTSSETPKLMSYGANTTNQRFMIQMVNGNSYMRMNFQGGAGGTSTNFKTWDLQPAGTIWNDGQWHHLALVKSGPQLTSFHLYLDGVLCTLQNQSATLADLTGAPTLDFTIGNNPPTGTASAMIGFLDDSAYFDEALDLATIDTYRLNGLPVLPPLDAPAGVSATASTTALEISVAWDAVTHAGSYSIRRGTASGGPYTEIGVTANLTFTDTVPARGVPYYYVVVARGAGYANSPKSAEVSATVPLTLENSTTRLVIEGDRIISAYDKVRAVELVSPEAASLEGMLRVQLVDGTTLQTEVLASQMTWSVIASSSTSATLGFVHATLSGQVEIQLGSAPGEILWTVTVDPLTTPRSVARVDCPVFATSRTVGSTEKNYLLPYREGRSVPIQYTPDKINGVVGWPPYPKLLFSQFIACLGSSGSFLLWADDSAGNVKSFGFTLPTSQSALFAARHVMPYVTDATWQSSYHVRLTFSGPDWEDAADIYRDWVVTQPWVGTLLRQRTPAPFLIRDTPLGISADLPREDRATLVSRLDAWHQQFGVPILYRPLGWEKRGTWESPDYFPPALGEQPFKDLTAALTAAGMKNCEFISGYSWKSIDAGFPVSETSVCETTREGSLRSPKRICRGSAWGSNFLQDCASKVFDLGGNVFHDDVDFGTFSFEENACFDTTHGHPIPCGPWEIQATQAAFQEIRQDATQRGLTDFVLTKEYHTEMLNSYLDASQSRMFNWKTEPYYVPLALYLFHDRVPVTFGWVSGGSGYYWNWSAMIGYGQIPCLAFWSDDVGAPSGMSPKTTQLTQDYYNAIRAHAGDFLLKGTMRRPLITSGIPMQSNTVDGKTYEYPLVIQSVWEDGQGNVGLFVINTNTQTSAIPFTVHVPGTGEWWKATAFTGSTKGSEQELRTGQTMTWIPSPGRLCSIVFEPDNDGDGQPDSIDLDDDNDELPDDWEILRGLDPWTEQGDGGAGADPDHDGQTNAEEYAADSNPLSPSSCLRILDIEMDAIRLSISWQGGQQACQVLESTPSLTPPVLWTPLYTNQPPTAVQNEHTLPVPSGSSMFYRIRAYRP